ncbi:MAG: hypothetical protein HQ478_06060 [Chloroflexi bacterium]|nr:hypothetical protein [Chloroflexota bacterium]
MVAQIREWIETTRGMMDDLQNQHSGLMTQKHTIDQEIENIEDQIAALDRALDYARESHKDEIGGGGLEDRTVSHGEMRRVYGQGGFLAVYEYVAERNEGVVKASSLARMVVDSGLNDKYESALPTVHSTLARAVKRHVEGWKRIGEGWYGFTRPSTNAVIHDAETDRLPSSGATAHCSACGEAVALNEPENVRMKNGRWRTRGKCSICGRNVSRFGKT